MDIWSRWLGLQWQMEIWRRWLGWRRQMEIWSRPPGWRRLMTMWRCWLTEALRGCLRRIKIMSPSFLFRRVFSGVARAGVILGGAYRRSFVAGYIFEFTTICAATYRRSVLAVYVAEFFSLCAHSWVAVGFVFNPLPAGTQSLPISDPPERLCFVLDMERLQLLVLSVLVLGAVLFISLEVLILAGVITRYGQYCEILKFVFTILQRLLVAYEKTCDFYNNIEWHRMDMALARNMQQLPPPAAQQQQLLPPVGEQQQLLPPVGEQQQVPPPATKQQQLPPPPTEQQQLSAHATEQRLLWPPLPPEMDIC
jgi:hypothetical protein